MIYCWRKIHARSVGSAHQEAGDRPGGGGVFATDGEADRSFVLTKIATVAASSRFAMSGTRAGWGGSGREGKVIPKNHWKRLW